jgi:YegS/Rv2252/BmrU family lipid kinase
MTYLHFIVNPISGHGKHSITRSLLLQYFPSDIFTIEVSTTEYKNHAKELAAQAAAAGAKYVIACGGDGTINEVASALVGTDVKLGILPVGSGNGLASNLKIPRDIPAAIAILQKANESAIDVGNINGHYFFSNTGIGIDAMIIRKYEQAGERTLIAYIKASLASGFSYKAHQANITVNGKETTVSPFMLFVSNSNEMGYNMSLTPKASLTDGWLDMVVVPTLNIFQKLQLGYHVLRNTVPKFKIASHTLVKELDICQPDRIFTDVQIDGEYYQLKTNRISISILNKALKVITP